MGAFHVHSGDILAEDLDNLRCPPSLVYPIHYPFRYPCLSYLYLLRQPYPFRPQPPQLPRRQCQLRQRRDLLLVLPLTLLFLLPHSLQLVEPGDGSTRPGLRNRVAGRAPARVNRVPDPVYRKLVRQQYEYLSGGVLTRRSRRIVISLFREAKGTELISDSLDCGLGKSLSVGGRATDDEARST